MPFVSVDRYPEFEALTRHGPQILAELRRIEHGTWSKWGSDAIGPNGNAVFLNEGDWTVFPVYAGTPKAIDRHVHLRRLPAPAIEAMIAKLIQAFPDTTSVLRSLDRVNYAAFSRLRGQTSLAVHRHHNRGALILHMGLEIPEGGACGLEVAGDIHTWREPGELAIFNDNNMHSAWNHSQRDRVVLYIDFRCDDPDEGLVRPGPVGL